MRRDVSFYGNKLFQSTFISIIAPGSSILTGLLWTLLNSFVALVRAKSPSDSRTIIILVDITIFLLCNCILWKVDLLLTSSVVMLRLVADEECCKSSLV